MPDQINLTSSIPVVIKGLDGAQLASDDQVYTWDVDAAEYGPQANLDRLVTHDTGSGTYDLVFHSDGSVVWH
jgi:hypothetical protein